MAIANLPPAETKIPRPGVFVYSCSKLTAPPCDWRYALPEQAALRQAVQIIDALRTD